MSLLIKNMKMPTGCASCDFWCLLESDGSAYCRRTMHLIRKMAERPEWCPILLELPEEHGPLIDADRLREIMKKRPACEHILVINSADVIVPAERN